MLLLSSRIKLLEFISSKLVMALLKLLIELSIFLIDELIVSSDCEIISVSSLSSSIAEFNS
jgi:hypothetical protein